MRGMFEVDFRILIGKLKSYLRYSGQPFFFCDGIDKRSFFIELSSVFSANTNAGCDT